MEIVSERCAIYKRAVSSTLIRRCQKRSDDEVLPGHIMEFVLEKYSLCESDVWHPMPVIL